MSIITNDIKALEKELNELINEIKEELIKELNELINEIEELIKEIEEELKEELNKSIKELNKSIKELKKSNKPIKEFNKTNKSIKELKKSIKEFNKTNKSIKELKKIEEEIEKIEEETEEIEKIEEELKKIKKTKCLLIPVILVLRGVIRVIVLIGVIGIIITVLVNLSINIIKNTSLSLDSFPKKAISILTGLIPKLIPILTALIAIWGIGLQIRNKNITEERQKWLTSLKLDVSKFMSILIKNDIRVDNDFDFLYYKIFFNLNENDELIDSQIINRMNKIKKNNRECKTDIEILENDFSDMFKFEWERIKIETGWRSYLPFIGTRIIKNEVITFKCKTAIKIITREIKQLHNM